MALLADNLKKADPKPVPGQGRSARPYSGNSGGNPDWKGGMAANDDSYNGRGAAANDNSYGIPTTDQKFSRTLDKRVLGPLGLSGNSAKAKASNEGGYSEAKQSEARTEADRAIRNAQKQVGTNNRQKKQLPNINLLGRDAKARVTVSRITAMNSSWVIYTWLVVQLPLAILSILSFGIVQGLDEITKSEGGILSWIVSKAASVADAVAKFIGIDFASIAFSVGIGFYTVILVLGVSSIMALYFQYVASGLRPTTGHASGLKMGLLLLTWIGYSTPLLNMFPFILLWMAAVWYHPK